MKKFFYLIMIILVIGLWLGINLAKNQPLFSNPFADKEIREKAAEKVERLGNDAKSAMERAIGKSLGD